MDGHSLASVLIDQPKVLQPLIDNDIEQSESIIQQFYHGAKKPIEQILSRYTKEKDPWGRVLKCVYK